MSNKPASEIVKEIRFDLRLSQKDFAEALGIAQTQVSRVESGKHDIGYNKLQQWCETLKVSLIKYL